LAIGQALGYLAIFALFDYLRSCWSDYQRLHLAYRGHFECHRVRAGKSV
jgi:hypothetical protein